MGAGKRSCIFCVCCMGGLLWIFVLSCAFCVLQRSYSGFASHSESFDTP